MNWKYSASTVGPMVSFPEAHAAVVTPFTATAGGRASEALPWTLEACTSTTFKPGEAPQVFHQPRLVLRLLPLCCSRGRERMKTAEYSEGIAR